MNSFLIFSLAPSDEEISEPKKDLKEKDKDKNKEKSDEKEKKKDNHKKQEPLDISVELVDTQGDSAKLKLSEFRSIPPVLKSRFTKMNKENKLYGKSYEPTLQIFELPLSRFASAFPEFDPGELNKIKFVFDQDQEGVIILDRIGIGTRRLDMK